MSRSSPSSLFAIGQRIRFWHGKRKTSAVIYAVGPTMYCVTAWFGRNYVNLGIDHDAAWLANAEPMRGENEMNLK